MLKFLGLEQLFSLLFRRLLYVWVRPKVLPLDPASLELDLSQPVCYVLHQRFLSNLLVLETETQRLGLPRPLSAMSGGSVFEKRSFFFLNRGEGGWPRPRPGYSPRLSRLIGKVERDPALDVQIVPVTILWGRAPDKQDSIFKLLFADGWANTGRLSQFFTVLLHGRQAMIKFGRPVSVREMVDEKLGPARTLRKAGRLLRVHFRRQREQAIGPDLSHRRTQVDLILNAPDVRQAILDESATKQISLERAQANAHKFAMEIAADYSHSTIRIFDRFLNWLWNRLYDGVEISRLDEVAALAHGHEIVYVPSHRSHIDYLLMSYLLYRNGLLPPHIAAGANLNLPVVGPFLRRSGAFFLRRSFKGEPLYAAVFNEYLHMMISRGFPIEYFIEGGRSRTGRLLPPKAGMLAMTTMSYLRDTRRPLLFLPVYIGYEKLMEGGSYVAELSGRPKRKESLFGLLATVRQIKKTFGKVYVNFGEPILLSNVLDSVHENWRGETIGEQRPKWFTESVDTLANRIVTHINGAAVVNPINLLALVLLSTPKHSIDASRLAQQIRLFQKLIDGGGYSQRVERTAHAPDAVIAHGEALRLIERVKHPLGDVLRTSSDQAILLAYFRNNVLHLVALPAIVACLFVSGEKLSQQEVIAGVRTIYPFLRSELFLPWATDGLEPTVLHVIDTLAEMGLLRHRGEGVYVAPPLLTPEYSQLDLLGQTLRHTLERYFMAISVLIQQGSSTLEPRKLEALCHLLAQRLSLLFESGSPDFFDKTVFRNFIDTLRESGMVTLDEAGKICFGEQLTHAGNQAQRILPAEVRQAVLDTTGLDEAAVAAALAEIDKTGR